MAVLLTSLAAQCVLQLGLGRRGFSLESAAARVCREAGGRVSVIWRLGQQTSGSGGRRVATVPRRPFRCGHHHGESTEKGRFSLPSQCHCGWRCPGHRGTRQPENSKRAHLSAPALQTPIPRKKTKRERKKIKNCGGRGKKKARNFGRSRLWPIRFWLLEIKKQLFGFFFQLFFFFFMIFFVWIFFLFLFL